MKPIKTLKALVGIFLIVGLLNEDVGALSQAKNLAGKYTWVNGRQMYFEQYGEGRPLVFLHGGAGSIDQSFSRQIPSFAKTHRVIAIEQIGHGHTPDANIPFAYRQMAEDTAALLRQLKIQNADIVGWSDGGNLALLIARFHPDLVRRLVVSGANSRLVGLEPSEIKRISESAPEELAGRLGLSSKVAYAKMSPDGVDHWPQVAKKIWDLWLTPVVLTPEDLAAIQAPTLVAAGDTDVIPIDHTVEIYQSLPHARLLVLPNTGHDTFNSAATTFNPIILSFIDTP